MTTTKLGLFLILPVALAIACQGSPGGSEDSSETGTSETGASGVTDGSESGDTSGVEETPILERTPTLSHDCKASVPLKQVANSDWRTESLAVLGGVVWQVRSGNEALSLSTVAADGSLGTSVVLDGEAYSFREADLVAGDGRLAAAWVHTDQMGEAAIHFAVVGGDGTIEVAAHALDGISGQWVQSPRVLPRAAGGWTLFYGTADGDGAGSLRMVQIDAAGQPVGASVDVGVGGQNYGSFAPSVVATADGHALTYTDNTGAGAEVFFVALDAEGAPRAAPRRLSHTGGDGWWSSSSSKGGALLAVGDRLWATWTESVQNDDFADPKGNTTVRVAVLDAEGEGPSYLLSAPVEAKSAAGPSLFAFGDRVGLTWTAGTMIFICGGCIADDDVKLVLLDPSTVAPVSPVVTHLHLNNGMVRPQTAVLGTEILLTADVDYHALTSPAVGATSCTPGA